MAGRHGAPIVLAALVAASLAACETKHPAPPPDKLVLGGAQFADLAGWSSDRQGEALAALMRSCERLTGLGNEAALGPEAMAGRVGDWRAACAEAATIAPDDHAAARMFFERRFVPLAATNNGRSEGLFTGYFEPELRGSLSRAGSYSVPLYGRPADLISVDLGQFRESLRGQRIAGRLEDGALRPYATRAEIEAGAIAGRAPEIVWVDDPIDAFFLHVQGSGRVQLDNGEMLRVGYAAQNGHVYVPIGRELIARGAMAREDVSMQSIRAWLLANPAEAVRVMNQNPSYVFFRPLDGEGPLGSQGVVLTPGRSLAVDRTHLALGVPIWLDAEDPLDPNARVRRLMVAQDTGGAIRGPVRGDVFWGHGAEAAERAGRMRSSGRYWLLLPREVGAARLAGR